MPITPNVEATARVVFDVEDRCLDGAACYNDGKPVKSKWPDVPWDKHCDAAPCTDKLSPVFFNTKRLTKIRTQVRSGSTFNNVESWTLEHEFKAPEAERSASLWLKSIAARRARRRHHHRAGGAVHRGGAGRTGSSRGVPGAPIFSRWRSHEHPHRVGRGPAGHLLGDRTATLNDLPSLAGEQLAAVLPGVLDAGRLLRAPARTGSTSTWSRRSPRSTAPQISRSIDHALRVLHGWRQHERVVGVRRQRVHQEEAPHLRAVARIRPGEHQGR